MEILTGLLGPAIDDAEEEAFLLFSQSIPSRGLGFVSSKETQLELTVGDRQLEIHQSPTLLSSNRSGGTTGAVVWEVTPRFANWIISPSNFLFAKGLLSAGSVVLELGCGVSGVLALTLSTKVGTYVATDQDYVMKMLQQNIDSNRLSKATSSKRLGRSDQVPLKKLKVMSLDWETDSISTLPAALGQTGEERGVDALFACDCIYNDALIEPFVTTCADICRLRDAETSKPTLCIVAQQLRSSEVLEEWLKVFARHFNVWRVPDELLSQDLREGSGFVVHIGLLKP